MSQYIKWIKESSLKEYELIDFLLNNHIVWNKDMIKKHVNHLNFETLSKSTNVDWKEFLRDETSQWMFQLLSWSSLSENKSIQWDDELIDRCIHFIDFKYFNFQNNEEWFKSLLKKKEDILCEKFSLGISCSSYSLFEGKSIQEQECIKRDCSYITIISSLFGNQSIMISEEIVISFIEKSRLYSEPIKWTDLSGSTNIVWSKELISKYKDEWHWLSLCSNSSIQWNEEMIDCFCNYIDKNNHYKGDSTSESIIYNLTWEGLSMDTDLLWTKQLIQKYKDRWDWFYLSRNESINHSWLKEIDCDAYEKGINNIVQRPILKDLSPISNVFKHCDSYGGWKYSPEKEREIYYKIDNNQLVFEKISSPPLSFQNLIPENKWASLILDINIGDDIAIRTDNFSSYYSTSEGSITVDISNGDILNIEYYNHTLEKVRWAVEDDRQVYQVIAKERRCITIPEMEKLLNQAHAKELKIASTWSYCSHLELIYYIGAVPNLLEKAQAQWRRIPWDSLSEVGAFNGSNSELILKYRDKWCYNTLLYNENIIWDDKLIDTFKEVLQYGLSTWRKEVKDLDNSSIFKIKDKDEFDQKFNCYHYCRYYPCNLIETILIRRGKLKWLDEWCEDKDFYIYKNYLKAPEVKEECIPDSTEENEYAAEIYKIMQNNKNAKNFNKLIEEFELVTVNNNNPPF